MDGLGGEHVSDWRSWRRQLARTEAWKHWLARTGRSPLRAPGEARRRQREYPIGYVANGPTLLRSSGCMCWNKLLELRWIERADRMRQLRHEVTLVARVLGRNAPERSPRPAEPGLQQTKWNNSFTFHLQHLPWQRASAQTKDEVLQAPEYMLQMEGPAHYWIGPMPFRSPALPALHAGRVQRARRRFCAAPGAASACGPDPRSRPRNAVSQM